MGSLLNQSLCENGNNSSCGDFRNKGKASVTRIFPPGCGHNIPCVNQSQCSQQSAPIGEKEKLDADKSSTNVTRSEYGNVTELVNISVLQELVKNLVKSEITDSLDVLVKNALTETCRATGINVSSILEQKLIENVAVETSNKLSGVENPAGTYISKDISDIGSSSEGILRDVAKQCFPTEGHVDKKTDAKLEVDFARKGTISDDFVTEIPEKSSSEIKFPRRRVTFVREYPPFCGRNAPCPTEEERLKIISGNKARTKELKEVAARHLYSKRGNLEEVHRPLKKTVRAADSGNNLVRERANTATKSYLFSHGKPSNSIKGDWENNLGRERASNDAKNNLVSHGNPSNSVPRDSETNLERERAGAATKNNSVSHGKPSNLIRGAQNVGTENRARDKVKETLALFRAICEELSQKDASNVGKQEKGIRRVDLKAMMIIREKGKEVNTEIQRIGEVPGVEVGDEFLYRVELLIVGVHRQTQAGIDYLKSGSIIIATSVIASGTEGYSDDLGNSDILIYSGHGGNGRKNALHEDQKLERGNLALKNSISAKNQVRVTRGFLKTDNSNVKNRARVVTYTYDGLYTVEKYWSELGQYGKLVYKFELRRIAGQPRVAWKRSVVKVQKWS